MNAELVQLIQLQGLDLRIQTLTRQRSDFPRQIESLELEIKNAEKKFQDAQALMEQLRKERRSLEGEVDVLRAKLGKYKDQLMSVKTNKEYTAVLNEIDACNKEIVSREDEVLDIMEKMDAHEKAVHGGQQALAARSETVRKNQAELRKQMEAVDAQLSDLHGDRSRLQASISASLLNLYSRIAGARKGVALAEARDHSCQVCHVRLRPQMFNEIKKNDQIITCESCNRILYYPANIS
ncbi:MAG TPA: C4-type zinc ribbon domain-containing protein [Acidobacteriota bacterium]